MAQVHLPYIPLIEQVKSKVYSEEAFQYLPQYEREDVTYTIYRFLVSTSFKVPDTIEKLKKYIEWRKNCASKFSIDKVQDAMKTKVFSFIGYDKEKRPCLVSFSSRLLPELQKGFPYDQVEPLVTITLDKLFSTTPAKQINLFVDFRGWTLGCVDRKLETITINTIINYFPHRLHACYLWSPPWYFKPVWSVLKLLLDEDLRNRVHFCNDDQFFKILKENFTDDQIPIGLNGKRKDILIEELIMSDLRVQ